jgi:cobalt-zinc-cadmium efflux system outer membrane protein
MARQVRLAAAWLLAAGGAIGALAQAAVAPLRAQQGPNSRLRFVAAQPSLELAAPRPPAVEPLPPPATAPHGAAHTGITLAELEAIALSSNPTLAQAAARVEAQRGQWLQVGLYPNPTAGYMGTEIGNDGRAGQQGMYVGQEFVTAGKLGLNRAAAAQQVRQAEYQLAAQQQRVINDVRTSYYDVLVAQRLLEATGELMRIGDEGVRTTESLLKAEEVSRVEVLQARIEAETARLQWQRAANRHAAAWRQLTAVVGVPDLRCAPLVGDVEQGLPMFEWCQSLERVLAASPELAGAQAEVARAEWTLRRAVVEPRPNLDVQAGTQYDYGTQYQIQFVQAGIEVPLFDRNQGNIRKAQAEITAARADVARLELNLQSRLAAAFERYSNARQQVDLYARQILPNAKASLELVDVARRQGEFSYLRLLTSQRTFAQANLAYLEALRELRQSAVAIEGLLLSDSLAGP